MNDYNRHYVRPGAQVSGTDIKTYDVGNFSLILSGVSVTTLIGELYIEYSVDFFDPRVAVPIGQFLPMAHISTSGTTGTDAAPLTGATIKAGSNIPGLTIFSTAAVTGLPTGRYLISSNVVSTAITASPVIAAGAGSADVKLQNSNANAGNAGFVLNTNGTASRTIDVTSATGGFTLSAGTGVIAGNVDVFVCQLSSGLTKPKDLRNEKLDRVLEFFNEKEQWDARARFQIPCAATPMLDLKDHKQGWKEKENSSSKVSKVEKLAYLSVDSKGETRAVEADLDSPTKPVMVRERTGRSLGTAKQA